MLYAVCLRDQIGIIDHALTALSCLHLSTGKEKALYKWLIMSLLLRANIYIITDKQTRYHFDANLKLRGVELPLAVLVPPIVCHGFHSNRLACRHAASLTVIDTY